MGRATGVRGAPVASRPPDTMPFGSAEDLAEYMGPDELSAHIAVWHGEAFVGKLARVDITLGNEGPWLAWHRREHRARLTHYHV